VCGSRAAAEDAVQEALARAWERSERGEHIESLKAWVTTVAVNLLRSGFRRLRAERRARARAGRADKPQLTASEDLIDIRKALMALPRRQREATVLRYYLDMDVTEVAGAMGVSEGTAKTTLHRARRAMARELREQIDEEANNGAGL
jgi:RNA polymerase sigma-70 factor (ECF subfamily)